MPRRDRLADLYAQLRASLHRFLAGIRVVRISPIKRPRSRAFIPTFDPAYILPIYAIKGTPQAVEPVVSSEMVHFHSTVTVKDRSPAFCIESDVRSMGIVSAHDLPCRRVSGDWTVPRLRSVKPEGLSAIPRYAHFPIGSNPEIFRPGFARFIGGGVLDIDPRGHPAARAGLEAISRQPIAMNPIPWSRLDREFILRSWDLLHEKAEAQLGEDPGRGLEMTAVFSPVDFSRVRRVRFDRKKRKLNLFIDKYAGTRNSAPRDYAIIIGVVRGTGKVLQVAMPID